MKSFVSILGLLMLVCVAVEARPKRSVLVSSPIVAAPVVASPVVVHSHPSSSSVVKTEQVNDGVHSSYSYSTEVRSNPVVHHTHSAVVAAPVAAVSTVHHTVPTYYYPTSYAYAYSPYHYIVGK